MRQIEMKNGLKVFFSDVALAEKVVSFIEWMEDASDAFPFYVNFKQLKRIVIYSKDSDVMNYFHTENLGPVDLDFFANINGSFVPARKEIWINVFNHRCGNSLEFEMVVAHEVSHFIMDINSVCSFKKYVTDRIYASFEEIRVNHLSAYLAKRFLGKSHYNTVEAYRMMYTRAYRKRIDMLLAYTFQQPTSMNNKLISLYEIEEKEFLEPSKPYFDIDVQL